ncbi:MAG: GGDEF domain-containing protein [Pseudomonadota bacterium]
MSLAIKTLQAEIHALHQDLREAKGQIHQLERMADRDALLPVLNRRAFMRELSRIISYVGRYDASACLIFVDLNDFKAVNDRFGHVAGDQALMRVADVLRSRIRESDVLGRLGGDEFGIILVNAGRDIAERKSAILRAMLTDEAVVYEGHSFTIDASFGVWPIDPAAEVESILARADEAMYEIKKARA